MICLTFRSCYAGDPVKKVGVFFSLISHYLRNIRFVPSSLRTKLNADGSFCSGQRQQQGCREKEWRLSERVVTSRYPVHFFASFYFLSLLLVHISCYVRCKCRVYSMVGTCRAQVISLLQTFFRSISLLASDGPLVDDMTSTGWLMKASPQNKIRALRTC